MEEGEMDVGLCGESEAKCPCCCFRVTARNLGSKSGGRKLAQPGARAYSPATQLQHSTPSAHVQGFKGDLMLGCKYKRVIGMETGLVYADCRVDPAQRGVGGEEADGAKESEEEEREDRKIAEEEHLVGEARQLESGRPEEEAVDEEPDGARSTCDKRPPVPAVVFAAEVEVGEEDGDGGRGDGGDDECEREEAKSIVDLGAEHRVEDEEDLEERRGKDQDAGDHGGWQRAQVPRVLIGDLAWDRVGLDRMGESAGPDTEHRADSGKRHIDEEPERDERQQRAEGHGPRRAAEDQEEVEQQHEREDEAGEEHGGEHDVLLPVLATQAGIHLARDKAGDAAKERPSHDHDGRKRAAVGRAQEAEERKHERDGSHGHELGSRSDKDGEEHGSARRTEDLAVDELPAKVLLDVFVHVDGVVAVNVAADGARDDDGDHHAQEADDDDRVDERKPVDPGVKHLEVGVPARCPRCGRLPPSDAVGVGDAGRGCVAELERVGCLAVCRLARGDTCERVLGERIDACADDAVLVRTALVVVDVDVVVVVQRGWVVLLKVLILQAAERKTKREELLVRLDLSARLCDGQTVDHPVDSILFAYPVVDEGGVLGGDGGAAHLLAHLVLEHDALDWAAVDAVTKEHASEVLALRLGPAVGCAELEARVVVVVLEHALDLRRKRLGLQSVHRERHLVALLVGVRRAAR
ncbi:hypothetical protein L1887_54983 [Cichorium endivia]|nr:hypothetical protein L1887_54983 [Cichorium endivia]